MIFVNGLWLNLAKNQHFEKFKQIKKARSSALAYYPGRAVALAFCLPLAQGVKVSLLTPGNSGFRRGPVVGLGPRMIHLGQRDSVAVGVCQVSVGTTLPRSFFHTGSENPHVKFGLRRGPGRFANHPG